MRLRGVIRRIEHLTKGSHLIETDDTDFGGLLSLFASPSIKPYEGFNLEERGRRKKEHLTKKDVGNYLSGFHHLRGINIDMKSVVVHLESYSNQGFGTKCYIDIVVKTGKSRGVYTLSYLQKEEKST